MRHQDGWSPLAVRATLSFSFSLVAVFYLWMHAHHVHSTLLLGLRWILFFFFFLTLLKFSEGFLRIRKCLCCDNVEWRTGWAIHMHSFVYSALVAGVQADTQKLIPDLWTHSKSGYCNTLWKYLLRMRYCLLITVSTSTVIHADGSRDVAGARDVSSLQRLKNADIFSLSSWENL